MLLIILFTGPFSKLYIMDGKFERNKTLKETTNNNMND